MQNAQHNYKTALNPIPALNPEQSLGDILVNMRVISPETRAEARAIADQCGAPLARVLLAERFLAEEEILIAQSLRTGLVRLRARETPPDPDMAALLPAKFCRRHALLVWDRLDGRLRIACVHPESIADLRDDIRSYLGDDEMERVLFALINEKDLHAALYARHSALFCEAAETDLPVELSCREFGGSPRARWLKAGVGAATVFAALMLAPAMLFGAVALWATLTLLFASLVKLGTTLARITLPAAAPLAKIDGPLPHMTIFVPLYKESEIAGTLVRRLARLKYPRGLLEILLLLEEDDTQTQALLEQTDLPPWYRCVVVPQGSIKTKPRAMNYAIGEAQGEIIGIYDAEDAPHPDQLLVVAERFATRPPEMACVQGALDYYNPQSNWIARCFTIEYASWFRVMLPGLAKLGLVVPLGGTTVFFRREALERVGGWDAHNVTEDADLGVRLARFGYRTELIPTTTYEEANNRAWPWVRQRSRWLKGYVMTYLVHMRRPRRLLRDLGAWKFTGFQIFFVAAISQFIAAPILWSFWLVPAGVPHPLAPFLGQEALTWLALGFLTVEALAISIGLYAVALSGHARLARWVPTLILYMPLAVVAMYKALWEIVTKPFYWDKTTHGHSESAGPDSAEAHHARQDKRLSAARAP